MCPSVVVALGRASAFGTFCPETWGASSNGNTWAVPVPGSAVSRDNYRGKLADRSEQATQTRKEDTVVSGPSSSSGTWFFFFGFFLQNNFHSNASAPRSPRLSQPHPTDSLDLSFFFALISRPRVSTTPPAAPPPRSHTSSCYLPPRSTPKRRVVPPRSSAVGASRSET